MRALLGKHGVMLRKSLGQNFVIDPNTIDKVVAAAEVTPSDHVLEIGAGAGALTLGLSQAAARVTAIEIDARLIPVLEEVLQTCDNVTVVHADALAFDLGSISAAKLVGNLPYNAAATIVLRTLEEAPRIESLTVMTQKEVGERLAADPGDPSYGATSVLTAFWGRAEVAATISRRAFWPVPNVDSIVVRIQRHASLDVAPGAFYPVVKAAFSQRRKTLRNSLASLAGSPALAESWLEAAGIDSSVRAESLGVDDFVQMTVKRP